AAGGAVDGHLRAGGGTGEARLQAAGAEIDLGLVDLDLQARGDHRLEGERAFGPLAPGGGAHLAGVAAAARLGREGDGAGGPPGQALEVGAGLAAAVVL